jgi:serine protease DegQ
MQPAGRSPDAPRLPDWLTRALERADAGGQAPRRDVGPPPRQPERHRRRRPAVALVAVVAAFSGGLGIGIGARSDAGDDGRLAAPTASVASGSDVSVVARALLPSVVQLETDDGLGSGVVYRDGGLILTAAHVVEGAERVTVRFADGRRVVGRVVGTDRVTDVGVVRAKRAGPPAAPLAATDDPQVGDLAVAIGSPFGLATTVTAGVISAVARAVPRGDTAVTMLQTDAPINPGNSGGALADGAGRVIGINDAIRTKTGVNSGIGFAIPIDVALRSADALVAGRRPVTGWIGIAGRTPKIGSAGALVTTVQPRSPSAKAGLRPGDLVTAIDGRTVADALELDAAIAATVPGTSVELTIERRGTTRQVEVVVDRPRSG